MKMDADDFDRFDRHNREFTSWPWRTWSMRPRPSEKEFVKARDLTDKELSKALSEGSEKRYDKRILVVGHASAGKTTITNRILSTPFNMGETESTNGIVIIKKGAIQVKDGKWFQKYESEDKQTVLKRMKAKSEEHREKMDLAYVSESEVRPATTFASRDMQEMKEVQMEKELLCRLMFWDFAGHSVFNTCHQMFMSHRALYLLVFDISKELDAEVEDDHIFCVGTGKGKMSIKEYTMFMLKSVHMYHGKERDDFPKVLLIGTHKDLVDENVAVQRMKKLKDAIQEFPSLQQHVVGDFITDNTITCDSEYKCIRDKMFEVIQNEIHWGEDIPVSWMPLEKAMLTQRDKGTRILTLQEVKDINKECYVTLESDDTIVAFLRHHNAIGSFIFFGNKDPNDIVILDPQWLIDSLKQVITVDRFYVRPEGLTKPWDDFDRHAQLHKKLIEAVWSLSEDKSFIKNKDKLLEILEETDIISRPKNYNQEGMTQEKDYVFVPSMLKPNEKNTRIIERIVATARGKSPALCFVFDEFMPPAVFYRLQAACIKEYRIKCTKKEKLLFYRVAFFQLDETYDLFLEQIEQTIRVVVINMFTSIIGRDVCNSVMAFLEETLQCITMLYGRSNDPSHYPFHKEIQCSQAAGKLEALHRWDVLLSRDLLLCLDHDQEVHEIVSFSLLRFWTKGENLEDDRSSNIRRTRNIRDATDKLNFQELGRLARRLSTTDLKMAALEFLQNADIERLQIENPCTVDLNLAILIEWSFLKQTGLNLMTLTEALKKAEYIHVSTLKYLSEALADKDCSNCFQGIPDSFLDEHINDYTFDQICHRTGKKYKQLAVELCLPYSFIDGISVEKDRIIDRTRAIIRKWISATDPTYRKIGKAIVEVGMDSSLILDCYKKHTEQIDT